MALIELGGRWIRLQSRTQRGAVRRICAESSFTIPAWHQANVPVKVMSLRPVAETVLSNRGYSQMASCQYVLS